MKKVWSFTLPVFWDHRSNHPAIDTWTGMVINETEGTSEKTQKIQPADFYPNTN